MSLKGFPTQGKNLDVVDGVNTELTDCRAEFVTLQKTRSKRVAMDTVQMAAAVFASKAFEAGTTKRKVICTAHGVRAGDLIRVTSGTEIYVELNVKYVIDANSFVVDGAYHTAPLAADTFDHLVYITQRVGASGSMPVDVITSALPAGASTFAEQAIQTTAIGTVNTSVGLVKTAVDTVDVSVGLVKTAVDAVTSALGTTNLNTALISSKQYVLNDCSSVNITTAAFVDLITSTAATKKLQITWNGGGDFFLQDEDAVSSALVISGFSGSIEFAIAAGKKLQAKAIGANITSGKIAINLLG